MHTETLFIVVGRYIGKIQNILILKYTESLVNS